MSNPVIRSKLTRGARRLGIVVLGLLSLTYLPYLLIGVWNQLTGRWRSVFFAYSGGTGFVETYAPRWIAGLFVWHPFPVGIIMTDGHLGLVLAAPVTETQFLAPQNARNFARLRRRIIRAARLMGIKDLSLAGILPGQRLDWGPLRPVDVRPAVVTAVRAAAEELVKTRFNGVWPPVIVVGAAGHVGVPVTAALREIAPEVHLVDPRLGTDTLPQPLKDRPALVIDIARRGILDAYIDQFWPGCVLLNETFPKPSRRLVASLSLRDVEVWHLSGFKGRILPTLPAGYEDAIPCCAMTDLPDPVEIRLIRLSISQRG